LGDNYHLATRKRGIAAAPASAPRALLFETRHGAGALPFDSAGSAIPSC